MNETKLNYRRSTYVADNSTAILCYDEEGYPDDVSICLADYGMTPPSENHIFIPTYNMDEETLSIICRDLVKAIICRVPIGYGSGILVELKDNWKDICKEIKH